MQRLRRSAAAGLPGAVAVSSGLSVAPGSTTLPTAAPARRGGSRDDASRAGGRRPAARRGSPGGRLDSRPRHRTPHLLARLVGALAAGGLLVLAFPGYDQWLAAPAATALLALCLHRARSRAAAAIGAVFGCAAMLPILHWAGVYVGAVPWIALGVASGLFYAPFATLVAWSTRSRHDGVRRAWPLAYAGLWVAGEAARSRVPFHGFPWARLAFSQADAPSLALASVGGAPLVAFAVALAGGLLAAAVLAVVAARAAPAASTATDGRPWRRLRSAGVPLALATLVVAGPALIPRPTAGEADATGKATVRVAMIQGNVDRSGLRSEDYAGQVLANHVRLTEVLAARIRSGATPRPDFVLWPENAADDDPTVDPVSAAQLTRAADDVGVPIVAGVILDGPGAHRRNAVLIWDPRTGRDTSATGTYVKRYPAPFGEYIPLRSIARRFSSAVDLVPVDMARGTVVGRLLVNAATPAQVALGPAICFEVAFDGVLRDDVRAGAQLLVVPTNNATFGHSDESVQQLAMARLRAVEHGRTVLSDSTVGVSAVIRPDGSLVGATRLFTPAIITATVPLRHTLTLSDRLGGGLEWVLVAVGLTGAAVGVCSRGRRDRRPGPDASRLGAGGETPRD